MKSILNCLDKNNNKNGVREKKARSETELLVEHLGIQLLHPSTVSKGSYFKRAS
jgi:hypothetical protein